MTWPKFRVNIQIVLPEDDLAEIQGEYPDTAENAQKQQIAALPVPVGYAVHQVYLTHQHGGIHQLEYPQGQHQGDLHQAVGYEAAVHGQTVGRHGGDELAQALHAAAVGKAEAIHVVVRQQVGLQIAVEHHQIHEGQDEQHEPFGAVQLPGYFFNDYLFFHCVLQRDAFSLRTPRDGLRRRPPGYSS